MSQNAKNRLYEFIRELGYPDDCLTFRSWATEAGFAAQVQVNLGGGYHFQGEGSDSRRTAAEIAAAAAVLPELMAQPALAIDWEAVFMEAQAGDALIKLAAYLDPQLDSAAQKSHWLQRVESDAYLVARFDQWQAEGHPAVAVFGPHLGQKRKATWMEAQVWRTFGAFVRSPAAGPALKALQDWLAPD